MSTEPTTTILDLRTDAGWKSLLGLLSGDNLPSRAAANIVEQLREAGAKSALLENDYLDRDYSEEYSAFYSKLFQRYRRRTRRLHFFRSDLMGVVEADGLLGVVAEMQKNAGQEQGGYLGFVVLRPVLDAPIGRAVLGHVAAPKGLAASIEVRSTYDTHPLGTSLSVQGMPFTQQDQRVSACAQASIWMSGRHFYTRHGGPWFSTVAITEAASKPTDFLMSQALPIGSRGLGLNSMLRALRAMDRHPYAFAGETTPTGELIWKAPLSPQAMISRYVGSGIPVIAGLKSWDERQPDGHAVVVVGQVFRPLQTLALHTSQPTMAELIPYFLVHDDQRGPNLRMGVEPNSDDSETEYNLRDHLQFLIVPLPDKVYITAETAEIKAWSRLDFYRREWPGLKAEHSAAIGKSVTLAERVLNAIGQNRVLARTYLTMGWKYKRRLHECGISSGVRSQISVHELPRMVWVTEFSILEDVNTLDIEARRIFGHCVTDATSTGPSQSPSVIHLPGFLWLTRQVDPDFYVSSDEELYPLLDDVTYRPRIRRSHR